MLLNDDVAWRCRRPDSTRRYTRPLPPQSRPRIQSSPSEDIQGCIFSFYSAHLSCQLSDIPLFNAYSMKWEVNILSKLLSIKSFFTRNFFFLFPLLLNFFFAGIKMLCLYTITFFFFLLPLTFPFFFFFDRARI